MTLYQLAVGSSGIVLTVEADGLSRRRLLDLGLIPGTVVRVLRASPAGDPVAYLIRGTVVALRSSESNQILVKPL